MMEVHSANISAYTYHGIVVTHQLMESIGAICHLQPVGWTCPTMKATIIAAIDVYVQSKVQCVYIERDCQP